MTADATDRLLAPYRAVRRIAAPVDGPWSGVLTRTASGLSGVLVDARTLGDDWAGWDAGADGHIAAPLDLVRTADSHQVLLPACVERLTDFLRRRRDAGVPVGRGEAVTIGVSLVRAIAELGSRVHAANGEWWLTDDRRPVIAMRVGESVAADETLGVVREVSAEVPGMPWEWFDELVAQGGASIRDCTRMEDELFAHAAAEPLADSPLSPRRSLVAVSPGHPPRRVRETSLGDEHEEHRGWMDQLTRHVDGDLADAVSRATTGVWRRLRTRRPRGRRSPLLVAAAVGAVVVAGGLLWPAGESQPVAAVPDASASPVSETTADADPTPGAQATSPAEGEPEAQPTADTGLEAIASELLSARTACRQDAGCLTDVVAPGTGAFPEGVIDLDARDRALSIVDEFGGVAVLRADDLSGVLASQLIVVQQDGRRWLLRDVYVAQQP